MSDVKRYRKKPVVIEALRLEFSTTSQNKAIAFTQNKARRGLDGSVIIPTLEGEMRANTGDYIIKGVHGEFYPCKPDIFRLTYEEIDGENGGRQ